MASLRPRGDVALPHAGNRPHGSQAGAEAGGKLSNIALPREQIGTMIPSTDSRLRAVSRNRPGSRDSRHRSSRDKGGRRCGSRPVFDESLRTCMMNGERWIIREIILVSCPNHRIIAFDTIDVDARVCCPNQARNPDSQSETERSAWFWVTDGGCEMASQILGAKSTDASCPGSARRCPQAETSTVSALGNNNRRVHSPDLSGLLDVVCGVYAYSPVHTSFSTTWSIVSRPCHVHRSTAKVRRWSSVGSSVMRYRFFLYSGVLEHGVRWLREF